MCTRAREPGAALKAWHETSSPSPQLQRGLTVLLKRGIKGGVGAFDKDGREGSRSTRNLGFGLA